MADNKAAFDFDQLLAEATSSKNGQPKVHGAMMQCIDKNGNIIYSKIAGSSTLDGSQPLSPSAVLTYASGTKLIVSIALLQCIDRGLLTLDEDLGARILPELAKPEILDIPLPPPSPEISHTGPPTLPPPPSTYPSKTPITARHLLSHTSGLGFRFLSPHLESWIQHHQGTGPTPPLRPSPPLVSQKYLHPLLFEPGTGFAYGSSIDWAGEVVRRLINPSHPAPTSLPLPENYLSLEQYLIDNVFKPVGITSGPYPCFGIARREDKKPYQERLMELGMRDAATGVLRPFPFPINEVLDEEGGAGLSGTMGDFVAVLGDLVRDEPRLLSRKTRDMMFEKQISEEGLGMEMMASLRGAWEAVSGPVKNEEVNHGLGGQLVLGEAEEIGQPKGLLVWGGACNLVWWVSREKGCAGFFATQVIPLGEASVMELVNGWKKDFWGKFGKES